MKTGKNYKQQMVRIGILGNSLGSPISLEIAKRLSQKTGKKVLIVDDEKQIAQSLLAEGRVINNISVTPALEEKNWEKFQYKVNYQASFDKTKEVLNRCRKKFGKQLTQPLKHRR